MDLQSVLVAPLRVFWGGLQNRGCVYGRTLDELLASNKSLQYDVFFSHMCEMITSPTPHSGRTPDELLARTNFARGVAKAPRKLPQISSKTRKGSPGVRAVFACDLRRARFVCLRLACVFLHTQGVF